MVQKSRRVRTGGTSRQIPRNNRLLLVVDQSSSSKHAVEYLSRVLASRRGFQVCLAHFLPPLPSELLEFGGAEDPNKERQMSSQLKAEQQRWLTGAKKEAQPALNWACTKLRRAGLPAGSVTTQFSDPFREQNGASEEILQLARTHKCRTIVVGRLCLPWLRRLAAGKDLAERLVQQGKGFTLWVVE